MQKDWIREDLFILEIKFTDLSPKKNDEYVGQ